MATELPYPALIEITLLGYTPAQIRQMWALEAAEPNLANPTPPGQIYTDPRVDYSPAP